MDGIRRDGGPLEASIDPLKALALPERAKLDAKPTFLPLLY